MTPLPNVDLVANLRLALAGVYKRVEPKRAYITVVYADTLFQVEHTTPDMFGHAEPLTVCANGADVTRFLRDEDRDGIFAAFSDTWYAASIDPDDEDEEEDDPDNWMEGRGGVMVRVMRRTA